MSTTRDPRFVPLEGSLNFRDFGGYKTSDGGTVKRGKLFRCGALSGIDPSAYNDFARLDIEVICDLRRHDEQAFHPTPTQPPFQCQLHIPIAPGSSNQLKESFQDRSIDIKARINFMKNVTREIARDHLPQYQQLFDALHSANRGFLLHCSAGKDRTGFGAAMILLMLGVSEEDVFDDYLLSNDASELMERMAPSFKKQYGDMVDDANLQVIAGVKYEYLRTALDEVVQQNGSYEGYFDAIGMTESKCNDLKNRLINYPA